MPDPEVPSKRSENATGFTVQDCTYRLGLQAIPQAAVASTWQALRLALGDRLPYNSRETRRRYLSSVHRWALEGGDLSCLAVRVWKAYQDNDLLGQILRERYLAAYPVLGRFVSEVLMHLDPGDPVGRRVLEDYLNAERSAYAKKTVDRLRITMRDLGFLRITDREAPAVVNVTRLPGTAFLVLLHHHFAAEPTTVALPTILAHPFWQYLGGREDTEVRDALSLAAARDAIARYATVDNLEQITTRYSLEELLRKQVRL